MLDNFYGNVENVEIQRVHSIRRRLKLCCIIPLNILLWCAEPEAYTAIAYINIYQFRFHFIQYRCYTTTWQSITHHIIINRATSSLHLYAICLTYVVLSTFKRLRRMCVQILLHANNSCMHIINFSFACAQRINFIKFSL